MRKEKKNRSIYLGYQTFRDPSFQAKNGSKIQLIYLSPLTFHFHDLVGVLNHLIFGFVAEGMSPGLNQVQNLVSDIWFRLFLVIKDWEWIFTPLTPSFIYNLEFCNHITLVQQSISNTSWIKQLKEKKKKTPVTRLWHHQEIETSMSHRSLCHMIQQRSNEILLAHAVMLPDWIELRERVGGWESW